MWNVEEHGAQNGRVGCTGIWVTYAKGMFACVRHVSVFACLGGMERAVGCVIRLCNEGDCAQGLSWQQNSCVLTKLPIWRILPKL